MIEAPHRIAEHMAAQHGTEAALKAVSNAIFEAQAARDNLRLSVLREVRRILRERPEHRDHPFVRD